MAKTFPAETIAYRRARHKLLRSEIKMRRQIEAVAAERRNLPLGGVVKTDYVFDGVGPGGSGSKPVHLSDLFAPGKTTLVLYNFMFPKEVGGMEPCPSCTSILDSVDGAALHVSQRINFVVV